MDETQETLANVDSEQLGILTQDEVDKITGYLENGSAFEKGLLLSLFLNMTQEEACMLKWSAIDCKEGTALVMQYRFVTKDGHRVKELWRRNMPLSAEVLAFCIQNCPDPADVYALTGTDTSLTPTQLASKVRTAIDAAGIQNADYGKLRKTFSYLTGTLENHMRTAAEYLGISLPAYKKLYDISWIGPADQPQ